MSFPLPPILRATRFRVKTTGRTIRGLGRSAPSSLVLLRVCTPHKAPYFGSPGDIKAFALNMALQYGEYVRLKSVQSCTHLLVLRQMFTEGFLHQFNQLIETSGQMRIDAMSVLIDDYRP